MLTEITRKREETGEADPRWFTDDYFDLYVWINPAGDITQFQLCYDKRGNERAVSWIMASGFRHYRVDAGEQLPTKNRTPILVPESAVAFHELEQRFEESSRSMNSPIASFVKQKLIEHRKASPEK